MFDNYSVKIEEYAERHFIKSFKKKYKNKWDFTLKAIIAELNRIDNFLLTNKAEIISSAGSIKIIKTEFKIAGTKESAKTSGNRCIVAWNEEKRSVSVLLVYGKTDLSGKNETAEWQNMLKKQYPVCKDLF